MIQKLIVPITSSDFEKIEEQIGINQDEYCPYCDYEKKLEKYIFKDGKIIYLCYQCDTVWEKEIIDKNHFKLVKSKEGLLIC